MKKRCIFFGDALGMSGVSRLFVDISNHIDKNKVEWIQCLKTSPLDNSLLLNELNNKEITYCTPDNLYRRRLLLIEEKKKSKNIWKKWIYCIILKKIERAIVKKIQSISDKETVLIDFCGELHKVVHKIKAKKKIIFIHSSKENIKSRRGKKNLQNMEKYDIVVTICQDMSDQVLKLNSKLNSKIIKIYNPVDIKNIVLQSEDDRECSPQEKLLLQDEYIVMVSRLQLESKDYITLLKSYAQMVENGIKEKLYIIGDGDDRKTIEDQIKILQLQDRVFLMGLKKNPYIWMSKSKCCVLSSVSEGFGLVLVESLALGKVTISTNCPIGPNEILKNGQYGYLVPMRDVESLTMAMTEALQNTSKVKTEELINRANDFSIETIIKEYEALILE